LGGKTLQELQTQVCKAKGLSAGSSCTQGLKKMSSASSLAEHYCSTNSNGFGAATLNYGMVMYIFAIAILFVLICPCCCGDVIHKHPHNLVLLGAFTVSFSGLVCQICMTAAPDLVATAAMYTCLVVGGLVAYASQTKRDFTGMFTYIYGACWAMICFMFISWFFPMQVGGPMYMLYNFAFGLIFAFFLIYDIQMVIGGSEKKAQYTLDDHVIAALNIYLDIINLFIIILNLLQGGRQ